MTPVNENLVYPIEWMPEWGYRNGEISKYNQVLQVAATKENIAFIKLFDALDKKHLSDGLHTNSEGHEIAAQLITQELDNL